MKKILLILTIILIFASCCPSSGHQQEESVEQKRTQSNLNRIDQALHKVEFSGHSYIIFYNAWMDSSAVFMLHDPDCYCQ